METTVTNKTGLATGAPASTSALPRTGRGVLARIAGKSQRAWSRFWMRYAGLCPIGRFATRLATLGTKPCFGRVYLADLYPHGYVAPSAAIDHDDLRLGRNVFLGDNVVILRRHRGGPVQFEDNVHLYGDTFINTGENGSIRIGEGSHIQHRCHLSAFYGSIQIGCRAEIAPNCAFYAHNHGIALGTPIREQPLSTKGGVVLEDDVWLGFGVVVLDGVHIGAGAVIAAGSVVTTDIPSNAIASGNPARIVSFRQ
jgi:acetyltransferase-like isoleucine patch superfamily enzyme